MFPCPWACEWGEDAYGLWQTLCYSGVRQVFRWIEPGTFLMGSPNDEPEREWQGDGEGSETQRPVTLSQGFWLADTTVTQAFWLAVLGGENPSRFQGSPEHPVEQVSWDDAQRFIEVLNSDVSGLSAQLPSEAQWEYACRAGTSTPFSFGNNISPKQVNYNGKYPYAGAEKSVYRENTVAVKSLLANPWGLFEMHGNVWEWCQDGWRQNLGTAPVIDPLNSAAEARVLRGGSWYGGGKDVRSAIRGRSYPGFPSLHFSFRLALGHAELRPGLAGGAG